MPWVPASIPIAPGQRGDIDAKVLPPGSLAVVTNGLYDVQGIVGKRPGFTSRTRSAVVPGATAATSVASGSRFVVRADELAMVDTTSINGVASLWSWSPAYARWSNRGHVPSAMATTTSVGGQGGVQAPPDIARGGGFTATVYVETEGSLCMALTDDVTGAFLDTTQSTSSVPGATGDIGRPRVIWLSPYFIVLYVNTATHHVWAIRYDTTMTAGVAGGWGTATDIGTSDATWFDVATATSTFYTFWPLGGQCFAKSFSTALAASASFTVNEDGSIDGSCDYDGTRLAVAYSGAGRTRYAAINAALGAYVLAPMSMDGAVAHTHVRVGLRSNVLLVTYDQTVAANGMTSWFGLGTTGPATSFNTGAVNSVTKPFFVVSQPLTIVYPASGILGDAIQATGLQRCNVFPAVSMRPVIFGASASHDHFLTTRMTESFH